MLILYLAGLVAALYGVSKILLPEMAKPSVVKTVPKLDSYDSPEPNEPIKKIEKLETLLLEKNKDMSLLTTELKIANVQVYAFEKVKKLMDEEIQRLREQNRIFRSELGMPTIQAKENSIA